MQTWKDTSIPHPYVKPLCTCIYGSVCWMSLSLKFQSTSPKAQRCFSIYTDILILRCVKIKLGKFPAYLNPFMFRKMQLHCAYSYKSMEAPRICSEGLRDMGRCLKFRRPALPAKVGSPPLRQSCGPHTSFSAHNSETLTKTVQPTNLGISEQNQLDKRKFIF